MRATWRWALSDLRAHRAEALFALLASAGVITCLLLSAALLSFAANPWQRLFSQSRGAHVWLRVDIGTDLTPLISLAEVDAVSEPLPTTETAMASAGVRARVVLREAPVQPPDVARPLVTEGRWARPAPPGGPGEVVLEHTLARALWADPGETVTVTGPAGTPLTLRVVGIAQTAEPGYRAGRTEGIAWASPAALGRAPDGRRGLILGVRLKDPDDDTEYAVQRAVTLLGASNIHQVTTWRQAQEEAGGDRLLGQVFAAFGTAALVSAAVTASGAVRSRVRGQLKDITVLKAVGFTPGQVVRGFLIQHLGLAVAGAAVGTAVTLVAGPRLPGVIGEAARLWPEMPGHGAIVLGLPMAAALLIGLATGVAAWQAGQVPPVPAARAVLAAAPLTRLGRSAIGLRLSPALVLGWRSVFSRRARTAAPLARLALPVALMTVALTAWSTLGQFHDDPTRVGRAAALTVRAEQPGEAPPPAPLAGVEAVYPGVETVALAPGQTGTIVLRGLGDGRTPPYPHTVAEGRAPDGPDEAVAGQGLLDLLDVRVGEWIRVTVSGRPLVLHLVGRSIEPGHGGRVVTTSLDTVREAVPGLRPDFHALVLHPGADPRAVADAVRAAVGPALDVRATPEPADEIPGGVLVAVIAVLASIALVELHALIATRTRARVRDLPALRAVGLTPRQIGAVIVTGVVLTAVAAAVAGAALGAAAGWWLVEREAAALGVGAGITRLPSPAALVVLVASVTTVAAGAALAPAARMVRRRLLDAAGGAVL
ncbi:ABC transporter permease [Streptomyces sp. NPDC058955]|uniref:ABC transporter permease n=1 Tax=Streptomyces sp. NPDC058955 TaxID=3346678 RepID=UPI0036B37288